jgi:hypothetical protein
MAKTVARAKKSGAKKSGVKRASAKKSGAKKSSARKRTSRRELIDTGTDQRYVRRDAGGKFNESVDVSRSLVADRRKTAKTKVRSGQGDKGDR